MKRRNQIVVGLMLVTVMLGLLYYVPKITSGVEYRTFTSPDGRFNVVVYRSRQWIGAMPGQAGDAPGKVCLYENATGKLVEHTTVEMIQLVEQLTWSATNVDIKFVADWKLP